MINKQCSQIFAASALAALLSACGGGGDDNASNGNGGTPGGEVPTTPATPDVPSGTPVTYAPGSTPAMALEAVNDAISHCGYPRMTAAQDLSKAAQAHMDYIAQNGFVLSHDENPSRPGFTGVSFFERIVAAGGSAERANQTSEGVGSFGGANGLYMTKLLAAPHHQADLLQQWSEIGIGSAADPQQEALPPTVISDTVVFNYGGARLNGVAKNEVRTFPCEGSTRIPLAGGPENPDPAPGLGGQFGPGLNFETNKDGAIEVTALSLRNVATGEAVPVQQVKGHNLEGVVYRSVWISKGYLAHATVYRVEATGNTFATKNMTGSATPWSKSYMFTTL